jgi:hypothetical protein
VYYLFFFVYYIVKKNLPLNNFFFFFFFFVWTLFYPRTCVFICPFKYAFYIIFLNFLAHFLQMTYLCYHDCFHHAYLCLLCLWLRDCCHNRNKLAPVHPHLYVPARLLESTIKDGSGIRKQDAGGAFGAVARNEIGNEMAFHFMRSNFLRMKEQWVSYSKTASYF